MGQCSHCGKENRAGAKFCIQCGALIDSPQAPEVQVREIEPAAGGHAVPGVNANPNQAPGLDQVPGPEQVLEAPDAETVPLQGASDTLPLSRPASGERLEPPADLASEPLPAPKAGEPTASPPDGSAAHVPTPLAGVAEERLVAVPDLPPTEHASPDEVQAPSPDAWTPLEPPKMIAGRYMLVEVAQQTDKMVQYIALDWGRCWQCGAERQDLADDYCPDCGVQVERGAPCLVQSGNIPADAPRDQQVQEGETWFWVQALPIERDLPPAEVPTHAQTRLRVGYASDPGQRTELDQDSVLALTGVEIIEGAPCPSVGLFVVADGMGGHDAGEVASRRVIQALAESLVPGLIAGVLGGEPISRETLPDQIREAVQEANRRLTHEAHESHSDMGSTLTLAFVHDGQATVANVGDSRTYLWRSAVLEQVTKDHSWVAREVEKGLLGPDDIYTHPRRSDIYRVMGDKLDIEVDVFQNELLPGDRLVLCCDGVWEMVRNEGIQLALLRYPDDPQAVCDELVQQANAAGGEDNISVITVDIV